MAVSVELLLELALLIALAFRVVTWIWQAKPNNSFGCQVAELLISIALAAIGTGLSTVHYQNGEICNCILDLLAAFVWLLNVRQSASNMRD